MSIISTLYLQRLDRLYHVISLGQVNWTDGSGSDLRKGFAVLLQRPPVGFSGFADDADYVCRSDRLTWGSQPLLGLSLRCRQPWWKKQRWWCSLANVSQDGKYMMIGMAMSLKSCRCFWAVASIGKKRLAVWKPEVVGWMAQPWPIQSRSDFHCRPAPSVSGHPELFRRKTVAPAVRLGFTAMRSCNSWPWANAWPWSTCYWPAGSREI